MKDKLAPPEFMDFIEQVMQHGIDKGYGADSWKAGIKFTHRSNHASMSRHLAEAYSGKKKDDDSGLHPLKHLATRALMEAWMDEQSELATNMKKSFE